MRTIMSPLDNDKRRMRRRGMMRWRMSPFSEVT